MMKAALLVMPLGSGSCRANVEVGKDDIHKEYAFKIQLFPLHGITTLFSSRLENN